MRLDHLDVVASAYRFDLRRADAKPPGPPCAPLRSSMHQCRQDCFRLRSGSASSLFGAMSIPVKATMTAARSSSVGSGPDAEVETFCPGEVWFPLGGGSGFILHPPLCTSHCGTSGHSSASYEIPPNADGSPLLPTGIDERLPVAEAGSSVVEFVAVGAVDGRMNAQQLNSGWRPTAGLSIARRGNTSKNKNDCHNAVPTHASAALHCTQPVHRIGLQDRASKRLTGRFTSSTERLALTPLRPDSPQLGSPCPAVTKRYTSLGHDVLTH
ncbi:hypothetical protein GON09_005206 [Rhodococcus sp. B50]|nr:hypothetical protein [Rhodococcus sp. B50]